MDLSRGSAKGLDMNFSKDSEKVELWELANQIASCKFFHLVNGLGMGLGKDSN